MASSGKKRDLDAPPSSGLGLCSGSVNPGQPSLQPIKRNKWEMALEPISYNITIICND